MLQSPGQPPLDSALDATHMLLRVAASHFAYGSALVAAVFAVDFLREAFAFSATVPAGSLVGFVLAAAVAAFACRRLEAVTPLSAAVLVLVGGALLLVYLVFVMRNISLPTGYPQTWQETAGHVVGSARVFGLLFGACAAGLLLALVRRLPQIRLPTPRSR